MPERLIYGAYGGRTKREHYEGLLVSMKAQRSSWDAHWQEIESWLFPRRTRFWPGQKQNAGQRRNEKIIDSTARYAARTLQSGLHAGLTSPARPWFSLGVPDPDLARSGAVKAWLHVVTERMRRLFATTNLYNALPIVYGDLGAFGTGAMALIEDREDLFRCYAYPLGSYCVGLDDRGLVTTFVREYQVTVRQVIQMFGGPGGQPMPPGGGTIDRSRFSQALLTLWDNAQYEQPVTIVWAVSPSPEARSGPVRARDLPWASCHFERGQDHPNQFLRESGFRSFPVLVPRWDVTGEDPYGTDCPGMMALGDVKQLQTEQKEKGKLLAKAVTPPTQAPTSLRNQKTSLVSGDITYIDLLQGQDGIKPIHEVRLEGINHLVEDIREVQFRIQRAFHEDLFLMLARSDRRQITATEVEERHEEKLMALGPVLERTNDELLDPLIDRVFQLMLGAGLVPTPPSELEGVNLQVEYVSLLATAQKLVGVTAQDRFLSSTVQLAGLFPEVRHKINPFAVVNEYADQLGINPSLVRSDDEAGAQVDAERQAQQEAAELAAARETADTASALGRARVAPDTALGRLAEGTV